MRHSIFHHAETSRRMTSDVWHRMIVDRGYEAIIFDCDGTLVESGDAHFHAFRTAIRAQGHDIARSWYDGRTGLDRHSMLTAFGASIDGPFDVQVAVERSIAAYVSGSAAVSPIRETVDLVSALAPTHRLAVVTNSENPVAEASLSAIGVRDRFDHLVTISGGLPPKPAPDLFIAAADLLDAPAANTLVFEDSGEGVTGARRAGMDVVQVLLNA